MASKKGTKKVKANPFATIQERYNKGIFYKAPNGPTLVATNKSVVAQFKKNPDFIYNVNYMVAGLRPDVEGLLKKYNYSDSDIQNALNDPAATFTINRINQVELDRLEANHKRYSATHPSEKLDLTELDRWREAEEAAKKQIKAQGGVKKTPRGDLLTRYNNRGNNVLSVSKLDAAGTGSRMVQKPTQKEASSPSYLPGLFSNNPNTYQLALNLMRVDPNVAANAMAEFQANLARIAAGKGAVVGAVVAPPVAVAPPIQIPGTPMVAAPVVAAPMVAAPVVVAPMTVAPLVPPSTVARISPLRPAGGVVVQQAAPGVTVRTPTRVSGGSGGFPTVMVPQTSPRGGVVRPGNVTF